MGNAHSQSSVLEDLGNDPGPIYQLVVARPELRGYPGLEACVERHLHKLSSFVSLHRSAADTLSKERDRLGFTCLHYCVILNWLPGLSYLLDTGIDPDIPSTLNLGGYSPLHLAAFLGNSASFELLLRHGANCDLSTTRGATPLYLACQRGTPADSIIKLLLSREKDHIVVDKTTSAGSGNKTPLHTSIITHGSASIVALLLSAGADHAAIMAPNSLTPLRIAAKYGRVAAMRELLRAGADPNSSNLVSIRQPDGEHHHIGVSPLLEIFSLSSSGRYSQSPPEATKREMFKLLRDKGADLNLRFDTQGFTILHHAMYTCKEASTIRVLLDSGCHPSIGPNIKLSMYDRRGEETMLHMAAKKGWGGGGIVKRLIEGGGDTDARNGEGFTALHLAVINKKTAAVDALLSGGGGGGGGNERTRRSGRSSSGGRSSNNNNINIDNNVVRAADASCLAPDIWPSYSTWKIEKGLRTVRALMETDDPVEAQRIIQDITRPTFTITAADIACAITRDPATLEILFNHGCIVSQQALDRVDEIGCPHMRLVAQRTWTPENHKMFPLRFVKAARELMRCLYCRMGMSGDVVQNIIGQAAFPVVKWADDGWLKRAGVARFPVPPNPALAEMFGGMPMGMGMMGGPLFAGAGRGARAAAAAAAGGAPGNPPPPPPAAAAAPQAGGAQGRPPGQGQGPALERQLAGVHVRVGGPGAAAMPPEVLEQLMGHVMHHIEQQMEEDADGHGGGFGFDDDDFGGGGGGFPFNGNFHLPPMMIPIPHGLRPGGGGGNNDEGGRGGGGGGGWLNLAHLLGGGAAAGGEGGEGAGGDHLLHVEMQMMMAGPMMMMPPPGMIHLGDDEDDGDDDDDDDDGGGGGGGLFGPFMGAPPHGLLPAAFANMLNMLQDGMGAHADAVEEVRRNFMHHEEEEAGEEEEEEEERVEPVEPVEPVKEEMNNNTNNNIQEAGGRYNLRRRGGRDDDNDGDDERKRRRR